VVYFREVQRLWVWVLFLVALAAPAVILIWAMRRALPGHAVPDRTLYLVCGPVAFLAFWFLLGRLITEVRDNALSIRFFLLWPERIIPWEDIRRVEVVAYDATSYGGWGVRWGAGGMAYTVSGGQVVRIQLKTGKEVLLGSQQPYELARAIADRINHAEPPEGRP
jgi:hypothetical protein